jgi:hypothetical protein
MLLRSMDPMEALTFPLHHLQIDMAMAKTTMPPTIMPIRAGVLKGKVLLDDEELLVGEVVELVGVGFEPAVGVTTPAPVLPAFPVTDGVVANPPKGVTEVPPYWLT